MWKLFNERKNLIILNFVIIFCLDGVLTFTNMFSCYVFVFVKQILIILIELIVRPTTTAVCNVKPKYSNCLLDKSAVTACRHCPTIVSVTEVATV